MDTHALIWWLADDPALSKPAKRLIEDDTNLVFISAASAFEVTTEYRIGKLAEAGLLAVDFGSVIDEEGLDSFRSPSSMRHWQAVSGTPIKTPSTGS